MNLARISKATFAELQHHHFEIGLLDGSGIKLAVSKK